MVHCPKCDVLNYDKRVLCAECGARLKKPAKEVVSENPSDGIYRGYSTT